VLILCSSPAGEFRQRRVNRVDGTRRPPYNTSKPRQRLPLLATLAPPPQAERPEDFGSRQWLRRGAGVVGLLPSFGL